MIKRKYIDTYIAKVLFKDTAASAHQDTMFWFFTCANEKEINSLREQVRIIKSFVNGEFSQRFTPYGSAKFFKDLPSGAKANFRYFLAMSETAWDVDRQNAFAKVFHSKRFNKNGELNHHPYMYVSPVNNFATWEESMAVVVPVV